MKKVLIYTIFAASLLHMWSCSKENPTEYVNEPRIYFWNYIQNLKLRYEVVNHSFLDLPSSTTFDTVYVAVQTMGDLTTYDRPVKVVQVKTGEPFEAVEGVHFVPLNQLSHLHYVPAGKALAYLPIVMKRDESLNENEYELQIRLVANEQFELGIPDYLDFFIYTSNLLTKPINWDTYFKANLGEWGPVKMQFLIDYVTGNIDWNARPGFSSGFYYQTKAVTKLIEVNNSRAELGLEPLHEADADKTPVSFPAL